MARPRAKSCFVASLVVIQTGCVGQLPPDTSELVAAADVINSVFCGLRIAQDRAQALNIHLPKYVKLTLELKVVSADSVGISAGGGGSSGSTAKTSVVSAKPTITLPFAPSVSLGDTQGWTVDTTVDVVFQMDSLLNPQFCVTAQVASPNPYLQRAGGAANGLSIWLGNTLTTAAAASIVKQELITTKTFVYDAMFSVSKSASGSIGFPLAIIPITPSASASRNDVQRLAMVLTTDQQLAKSSKLIPSPGSGSGKGKEGVTFAVPVGARVDFNKLPSAGSLSPAPYF